ncbi:MAG: polysaccharide biosynthesis/export family protein [Acidobacteriaceae bacterium]|nr:polysaccharide biosynthesis/export family protein [Acidobacteriaceae bacterium]
MYSHLFSRAAVIILLLIARGATAQLTVPPYDAPGSTSTGAPNSEQTKPVADSASSMVGLIIGTGDLLAVSVYEAPDFNKEVRVADSGDIDLPFIGSVHVSGLTVEQAEKLVQKKLADGRYFKNPQVSIFEKEYATQGISVLGEVQKPGTYPLPGSHTLFDAVSAAGGLTAKAGNIINITHRNNSAEAQTVTLAPNLSFTPANNVPVSPGDTVLVSKAGIVYVVGDVHMPSGFVMENSRLTVLQAIAMAQGTNTTAKLDKAVLIRKTSAGPQQIPLALPKILSAKAPDLALQPEDIVFIPHSEGKAALRRSLDVMVQAATGAAIYRPY